MKASWTIGAAPSADIRVASPYVSSWHCRLTHDGRDWLLEDLGSTNGTFVNGARITRPTVVSPSDRVTLGANEPLPWPPRAPGTTGDRSVRLPPAGRTFVIGRAASCDVVLDRPMVSARHAALEHHGGEWLVRDLGSTNGTFVAGRKITAPTGVQAGDSISLGSCQILLVADTPAPSGAPPATPPAIDVQAVAVELGGRSLLHDVSMPVPAGSLVGIMGPSGAGKSTLLAALVGSQRPTAGRVLVAGADLHARFDEFRGRIGFVPQDDILHADLTVRQALWYSARLRLPRDYSAAEIRSRVATVMADLGLTGLEDARIGSADRRGVSGGQRKRVNVALELITDPPILVLDEPTSGLSSTEALALVRLLAGLAAGGKTVVLTIHQPGIEILKLLDGLAVVARDESTGQAGTLAWYGPAWPDAAAFFEPDSGAADPDAVLRGLARRRVADWQRDWRASPAHEAWVAGRATPPGTPAPVAAGRTMAPGEPVRQWGVLVRRLLAVTAADAWATTVLLAQAPIIALLVVLVFGPQARRPVEAAAWVPLSKTLATVAFVLAISAIWFGCSNAAREIVAEYPIYRRERMVGLSRAAYVASKVVVLAGVCAVQCAVLLAIVRTGCALAVPWNAAFVPLFLAANVAVAIGLCMSATVRSAETAAVLLPLVILPMVILGGILLALPEMPAAVAMLADAVPSRWAFERLLAAEAAIRPVLERPLMDDPSGREVVDLAEYWFPADGWRSGPATPNLMLAAMWLCALLSLRAILAARERT
ncbi:MAG: FHA domain-containing protein [Planctomycetaceae bacterium]